MVDAKWLALAVPQYPLTSLLNDDGVVCVCRALDRAGARPLILKAVRDPALAPGRVARLRHEHDLLSGLHGPGVPVVRELIDDERRAVLVLEDSGGEPLDRVIAGQPCALPLFFAVALSLVDALDGIHRQHVIHRDLKPQNIVLEPDPPRARLIDFSHASRLSREHPQLMPANRLEGTVAYMAPEQTGRMNRAVDYRADYYALGVTFYELLSGQLPFAARDALELVHCHLARQPVPLAERVPGLPRPLSDITAKLMAKLAEQRYQSAAGLRADLLACQQQWQTTGRIEPFELGRADVSQQFQLPQKLYGREAEVASLLQAFERVSHSGRPELILIGGYSGVGKSALVAELHEPIVARRGYFIAGKFDQYQTGIPYASLAAALRSLVRQVLADEARSVERWRREVLAAVGGQGRIVIDLVPEAQWLIGPQPELPPLPADGAQRRCSSTTCNGSTAPASACSASCARIRTRTICWCSAPTATTKSASTTLCCAPARICAAAAWR